MQRKSGWNKTSTLYSLILRQTQHLQFAIIVLGLALPPLAVVPLHLQERIIDEGILHKDTDLIVWLAGAYVLAVVVRSLLKFGVIFFRGWIAEIVSRVLRTAMINAQRKRTSEQARESLGAATSVLAAEVEPLGGFAAEALNTPLIQGGTLLSVFGYMFATEWSLAAIGVVALMLEAIITPILQEKINQLSKQKIQAIRRAEDDVIGASAPVRGETIIKALGEIRLAYYLRLRMNFLKALLKIARNLIDHIADICVIAFGAWLIISGDTELGVIVAFLSALRQVRDPWGELVSFYRRLADAKIKYQLVRSAVSDTPLG